MQVLTTMKYSSRELLAWCWLYEDKLGIHSKEVFEKIFANQAKDIN